ncbi:gas vesicle protein [Kitasatospora camelliae]|uniref:Gas vesicle protein n=1 Tax=Kitasatospora camelliae TaxID=3156397 RepID=A0AAU8JPP4_9ACTN
MSSEPPAPPAVLRQENVALVDLLDRLPAGGVVVAGEITLSIADVDLVRISLRALIASVRTATGLREAGEW